MPVITPQIERFEIIVFRPWRRAWIATVSAVVLIGLLWLIREPVMLLNSKPLQILLIILAMSLAIYLLQRLSTARVVMTLDEKGIHQTWLRPYPFEQCPDRMVRWEEIVDYKFEAEPHGKYWFKATLRDGSVWSVHRQDELLYKQDDFVAFRKAFDECVRQYNQAAEHKGTEIRLAKTFTQSRAGYVVAVVLTVLLIAFPIALCFLYIYDSPAMAAVGIFGAVAFMPTFLFVYKIHLDRAKSQQHRDT